MEMAKPSIAGHHALLIGINAYAHRPLRGCVGDVEDMRDLLQKDYFPVLVQALTATSPSQPNSRVPVEEKRLWPTYTNVKSCLQDMASTAKPGDAVLIHYSGHGVRLKPSSSAGSMETGDVALALLDGADGDKVRYLRGLELAWLVKGMVDKGLLVTVVLDCCYSGGISRAYDDPDTVRELPYDATVDANYPIDPNTAALAKATSGESSRDISMLPNWIINPDGYNLLAACGPHEIAREVTNSAGVRRGALSYLLVYSLGMPGAIGQALQATYHRICAHFRTRHPAQTPILYGNQDLRFFGLRVPGADSSAPVSILRDPSDKLTLEAGRAHGVCEGDLYMAVPLQRQDASASEAAEGEPVIRVSKVGELASELDVVEPATSQTSVRTGWIAKPLTRLGLRRYPVLFSDASIHSQDGKRALAQRPSLNILTHDPGNVVFAFYVTPNCKGSYDIHDGARARLAHVPTVPSVGDGSDIQELLDLLEHLARFRQVLEITRLPGNLYPARWKFELIEPSNKVLEPDGVIDVQDGDKLVLKLENLDTRALYLYVFYMCSSWGVQNIMKATCEPVPASDCKGTYSGKTRKVLTMRLTPEARKEMVHELDILKVFITSRQASFASLEIAALNASDKDETIKGTPIAGPSQDTPDSSDWIAMNFHIKVYPKNRKMVG